MAIRHIDITKMELFKNKVYFIIVYRTSKNYGSIIPVETAVILMALLSSTTVTYTLAEYYFYRNTMSLVSVKEMAGVSFLSYNTVCLRFWGMQYRLCRTKKRLALNKHIPSAQYLLCNICRRLRLCIKYVPWLPRHP